MSSKVEISIVGIGIPAEVLFNPELSIIDQKLFGIIQLLSKTSQGCFASNNYLAQIMMGYSPQTITNSISKLNKLGYVKSELRETPRGTVRHVFIDPEYTKRYESIVTTVSDFLVYSRENNISPQPDGIKRLLGGGITDIIPPYNPGYTNGNNNKIYTSYIKAVPSETVSSLPLPKRNRPAPKQKLPEKNAVLRGSPCGQFISTWNNAPGPHTKHSLAGSSKTILRIKRYYNQLRAGIFFQDKKWNEDWLKRNPNVKYGIESFERSNQEIPEEKLIEILNSAMNHFLEGYWPQDKKTIPKSLADFIYNTHNQNSWFIKSMTNPPELLRTPGLPADQEYDPQSTNLFLELMGESRNNDRAVREINNFVKKMKECYELTVETFPPGGSGSGTNFHYEYPDWGTFVEAYGHWLEEQNWVNSIDLSSFRMGGGLVQHWFQELRRQFDYGDEDFKILRG